MFLQSLMKFDQRLSKILRKQNVTDTLSFVRMDRRTDNVKTVYPPTNTVCGGYKNFKFVKKMNLNVRSFQSSQNIFHDLKGPKREEVV